MTSFSNHFLHTFHRSSYIFPTISHDLKRFLETIEMSRLIYRNVKQKLMQIQFVSLTKEAKVLRNRLLSRSPTESNSESVLNPSRKLLDGCLVGLLSHMGHGIPRSVYEEGWGLGENSTEN